MPFLKKAEVRDAKFKYGFAHKGVFACENLKRGEKIFTCDPDLCDYLLPKDAKLGKTRDQLLEFMRTHPDLVPFINMYATMIDDDLYDWPRDIEKKLFHEPCLTFNHSCEPNCGIVAPDLWSYVAIKDIQEGEELTVDYQIYGTEPSVFDVTCKCGSDRCHGKLYLDYYRNADWQKAYYDFSTPYVRKKIDELQTKWHSSRCYLKYYECKEDNSRQLGLTVLQRVLKDELVAVFSDPKNITPSSHYIRDSKEPTCYLIDNKVYASGSFEHGVELTLNYDVLVSE